MSAAPTLFLGCADLFFATRIETTARKLGFRIERLPAQPVELTPPAGSLAIVDLDGAGDPLGWIRRFPEGVSVVAFVRHDEADKIRAAREAGASRVLSRGAFSQKLPALLKEASGDSMGA